MKHRDSSAWLRSSPLDLTEEQRAKNGTDQRNTENGARRARKRRATGLNKSDRTLLALLASCRYLTASQVQTILGGPARCPNAGEPTPSARR